MNFLSFQLKERNRLRLKNALTSKKYFLFTEAYSTINKKYFLDSREFFILKLYFLNGKLNFRIIKLNY